MAVGFLAHEVSDLCIGKPALRSLPPSATVGEALLSLKRCGDSCLAVWRERTPGSAKGAACLGKVCMVDIICYLCSEESLASPASALRSPVSALLPKDSGALISRVERHSRLELVGTGILFTGFGMIGIEAYEVDAAASPWF
ncbi:hypothetical protein Taro_034630 [Colocasia esculenta]|uniref:Uncharacterized protein n=1 Tax=Colocasia esculenta TaxID=4460 RepID=A0A843W863_COLES|nr:hypothetical protein [Colocasia esculenta]